MPTDADPQTEEFEPDFLPHRQRRLILWVLIAGIASSSFPITVLGAAIPEIAESLNTTDATAGWVLAGPLLSVAVATPIFGKLGDLFGHKRAYLAGFFASAIALVATGLAWDIGSLIGFRTVGSAFAAATGPAAMAIIMQTFPRSERTRAIGLWSAASAVSPTLGIVIGGPLIDLMSWRIIFLIAAGLAVLPLVAALKVLPDNRVRSEVAFDVWGALTLGAGVTLLLIALNRGGEWGFGDGRVIGGAIVGLVLLALFYWIEHQVESPLLPPQLLRHGNFIRPVSGQLFTIGPYMGSFVLTPIMLDRVFGYSTTARGLLMILRPIAFSAGAWVGGRRAEKASARRMGVIGAALIGIGTVLTGVAGTTGVVILVALALGIAGWGNGYGRPALIAKVSDTVDDTDFGIAGASFNMGSQIGAAAWITLMTTLLGDKQDATDFLWIYLLGGAGTIVAVLIMMGITESDQRP